MPRPRAALRGQRQAHVAKKLLPASEQRRPWRQRNRLASHVRPLIEDLPRREPAPVGDNRPRPGRGGEPAPG
jgi:hypothetical protein